MDYDVFFQKSAYLTPSNTFRHKEQNGVLGGCPSSTSLCCSAVLTFGILHRLLA